MLFSYQQLYHHVLISSRGMNLLEPILRHLLARAAPAARVALPSQTHVERKGRARSPSAPQTRGCVFSDRFLVGREFITRVDDHGMNVMYCVTPFTNTGR